MSIDARVASATNQSDPRTATRRSPHRTWRWSGGLPFVFVLALVGVGWAGLTASPAKPETALAGSSSYGPGIGSDSLSNTQVGGTACRCTNSSSSYRFLATQSSSLRSIKIYIIANGNTGYAHGTGGTLSISVQSDSGSSAHTPSGSVLASTSYRPGNPGTVFPTISFSSPAHLTAGRLYHIVFRNSDANPTQNFVSLDGLWTRPKTSPRQPGLSDLAWAQLRNDGHGWSTLRDYTPILDLAYTNGVHAGMGYMEVWADFAKRISGASAVREYLVPKANHIVSSVSVRVAQSGGSSPLTVRLMTSGGSVLATGSISAGSIGSSPGWATARLSKSVTLRKGAGYQLALAAPSGTSYSAFGVERGNNYGFASGTYFTDGYAQYTTGSGWHGLTDESGRISTNADLQFIFHATGVAAPIRHAPKKSSSTPHPTPKPNAAVAPSAAPFASASAAPPSLGPVDPGPIALVPSLAPSQPPVFRAIAEASARNPDLGQLLASFAITVVVLGGLGFALRRRLSL